MKHRDTTEVTFDVSSGLQKSKHSLQFLKLYSPYKEILDPFVGRGSILIQGVKAGFDVVGIDIDKNQCKITQNALDELL